MALTLAAPTVELGETEADGRSFTTVRLPGAGVVARVGEPALPVYRRLVEIPFGAELSVDATIQGSSWLELGHPVYPRQYPVPKDGTVPAFFMADKSYRGQPVELGARLVETVVARGRRLAVVEVVPVSYDPVRNRLEVASSMVVEVMWTNADWLLTRAKRDRYMSPPVAGRLDGVAIPALGMDAPPVLPVGYLMIVPDAWEQNIAPLAEWRRQKGFSVFVRNLTQVGGGSAEAVRDYIQNAYDNWPIPPSLVLLIGDVDNIGCFRGQGTGNPNTDLNFSTVDGSDYLPDIDVSRASVATAAQLDTLVANVLTYEQNTWANGTAWLPKAYFIASSDGGNHQIAESTHSYVMRKLRQRGMECDSVWLYHGVGTPIPHALDGGRSWVTYSGHGSTTSWADPSPDFDVDRVHALLNVDKVPYVQTYACQSGNFASSSYPECFSEAWIRSGRRGGIAHIASSVNSYWEEDDTLERRVFDCMFDSSLHWIMGGYNKAKLVYFQQMGSGGVTRRYLEMYNMIGDGAIDIYTEEPIELTVQHPRVIPLGTYPLHVSVTDGYAPVEGALACAIARSDTSVFATGYTDAGGQVVLTVTTGAPDSIVVTVTGHDLATHVSVARALPSTGAYVIYLAHTVDDSVGGNADGIINPGETINLPMWVKNWGSGRAVDVRTRLRTADPGITIIDSVKTYGTIEPGDSVHTGPAGFGFEVAPSCTNGYSLRFQVSSQDDNDSVWVSQLNLTVGAPVLDFEDWAVDDPPPGGNGNGMLDPGENGELVVTLRNTGEGHAYGVTAVIRSGDTRMTVPDSIGSFGFIPRDTTASNDGDRFRVQADHSIPRETQVPCTLVIQTSAMTYTRVFMLDVGVIRTCDPIPDGPRVPPVYYAYDVTDSVYTEAPEFAWVEIRGVGTRLSLSDDQTVQIDLPVGFGPLLYYGRTYTEVAVCGNGWVAPGQTTARAYNNAELPDGEEPPMVAANWDDLYPPFGGGVWYHHDADNHRFIVEWDSVHYYSPRDQWDKHQVIIYDTTYESATGDNVLLMQYLTANHYSSNSVGVEDPVSENGISYVFDGNYHRGAAPLGPGMAISYTTTPPRPRVALEEESGAGILPMGFDLGPCSPNPFRENTVLRFAVGRQTRLALVVYDPTGRRVVDLFRGVAEPGRHAIEWNGQDRLGRQMPAGVYIYALEAGPFRRARKMVLH